jgi:hypothetical protein
MKQISQIVDKTFFRCYARLKVHFPLEHAAIAISQISFRNKKNTVVTRSKRHASCISAKFFDVGKQCSLTLCSERNWNISFIFFPYRPFKALYFFKPLSQIVQQYHIEKIPMPLAIMS